MKILIIPGSSSKTSINRTLATHAASLVPNSTITVLDLNNFEMPIYSVDRETANGIPIEAKKFVDDIEATDALIVSLAEHNGSYTAAFKNILDWASRQKKDLFSHKPMLLMASSPGGRGGASVLAAAEAYFPHLGAKIRATFSLPSYQENFNSEQGALSPPYAQDLKTAITTIL